jgi:hypothetical protein
MLLKAQPGFLRLHAQQIIQLDRLTWRFFGHAANRAGAYRRVR